MRTIGIVAEYNPFHNGHLYHLEQTKINGQADCIVAVMSGNFTQRGEPAMMDKWTRAKMAVLNGIDLVIELPFAFACNNAEFFAKGAINILDSLGCVSKFSFGSENGDMEALIEAAKALATEDDSFKTILKKFLDKGLSYPKARYEALSEYKGDTVANVIMQPNNILAVEYLKEWIRSNSSMEPMTVKRKGSGYHDLSLENGVASATAIREIIKDNNTLSHIEHVIPTESIKVMNDLSGFLTIDDLFEILVYKILSTDKKELKNILSAGEGLENRLKKAIIESRNLKDVIRATKSKRYTVTRIQRLLIHTLIGLNKEDFFNLLNNRILYARILGFSRKGSELLSSIKKDGCSSIPLLNNINKELMENDKIWNLLRYDILSSDIYNLLSYGEIYSHSDFIQKPYIYS